MQKKCVQCDEPATNTTFKRCSEHYRVWRARETLKSSQHRAKKRFLSGGSPTAYKKWKAIESGAWGWKEGVIYGRNRL